MIEQNNLNNDRKGLSKVHVLVLHKTPVAFDKKILNRSSFLLP